MAVVAGFLRFSDQTCQHAAARKINPAAPAAPATARPVFKSLSFGLGAEAGTATCHVSELIVG